ncbi:MAG: hypothetical protein WC506_04795 [Candidatus Micrarchaeia archaeon]
MQGKGMEKIAMAGLVAAVVCLVGIVAILGYNYASQALELSQLHAQAEALNATNSGLKGQLDSEMSRNNALESSIQSINSSLASTEKDLEVTKFILNSTQAQLDSVQAQLEANKSALASQQDSLARLNASIYSMRADLNTSFSWFRENAILPSGLYNSIDLFRLRVLQDCTELNPTSQREEFNLACAYHRMSTTAVSISYKNDIDAGSVDHLQSLLETAKRWGGDCEDIALFSKATVNYIKQKDPSATVVAWQPGQGEFRVFPLAGKSNPGDNYYYFGSSQKVSLGKLSGLYPYVICYLEGDAGHCTVALSKAQANSSSQLGLLQGAYVYEPTWGEYLGTIGREFQICSSTLSACQQSNHYIWIIIGDNDIYRYGENGWGGFADIGAKLDQVQAGLAPA